ncbi:MAG: glutamine-hydrolyzing carbamoyl-phosphate synthase small subunit [bacterium]|nr:glutamine-hydrolyzing carbamoyl-phosphate synthase small subunit [bacterium]
MAHAPAVLALENGFTLKGIAIGAIGARAEGELVFNTAMTGYQEILTDPSYSGQILTFTYPHIGNTGVNDEDVESDKVQAAGLVVHELSRTYSNWRATRSLQEYLESYGIAGIQGVDTRQIVRILRSEGAMRCVIAHGDNLNLDDLVEQARHVPSMNGLDLTGVVTTPSSYKWNEDRKQGTEGQGTEGQGQGSEWGYGNILNNSTKQNGVKTRRKVAAIDFGIKRNILRQLAAHGCDVTVYPATVSAEEILASGADGVFLSNGPGDPAAVHHGIELTKSLLGKKPIFGICLGHQILSLAVGATTYKLTFGHRGANHPVKNLITGKIEITSQNHGFAVETSTLPANAEMTHINLNDNTCAGIRLTDVAAFGIQYHPEASPGPHDADYLFEQFVDSLA